MRAIFVFSGKVGAWVTLGDEEARNGLDGVVSRVPRYDPDVARVFEEAECLKARGWEVVLRPRATTVPAHKENRDAFFKALVMLRNGDGARYKGRRYYVIPSPEEMAAFDEFYHEDEASHADVEGVVALPGQRWLVSEKDL